MSYATDHTGPGSLSALMDFDHVIRVSENGTVTDATGVYPPDVYDPEPDATDVGNGWTLLNGYSGQYSYAGPWMHASELIAGGIARDILATPGFYVAVYPSYSDDSEPDSWAVAYKGLGS